MRELIVLSAGIVFAAIALFIGTGYDSLQRQKRSQ